MIKDKVKRYNKGFERDFVWYLSMRHIFNFDGTKDYYNKKGQPIIQNSKLGVTGKEAFYQWDSNGIITPTRHPNLLHALLKTKGSANLHIKQYAQDRANGLMPLVELRGICIHFKTPPWFRDAVENQKKLLWPKEIAELFSQLNISR